MNRTFLKVRKLPAPGPDKWAVCNHHLPCFEPHGTHWPHLIRCDTEAEAVAIARGFARHNPRTVVLP